MLSEPCWNEKNCGIAKPSVDCGANRSSFRDGFRGKRRQPQLGSAPLEAFHASPYAFEPFQAARVYVQEMTETSMTKADKQGTKCKGPEIPAAGVEPAVDGSGRRAVQVSLLQGCSRAVPGFRHCTPMEQRTTTQQCMQRCESIVWIVTEEQRPYICNQKPRFWSSTSELHMDKKVHGDW